MIIDVVMPARNEAGTVAANVAAARGCRHVRDVVVVDDGSADGTGDAAAAAGARVVLR
jgi:glycosyltransferase involved in cell wall biosynthesis